MMQTLRIIRLLVLFLFIPLCVNATDHYVDKNASGANNGTSWTNAWESFENIQWSSVNPGDIIYISGGTDSTVYYETFSIGNVQGATGNPITIKNSYDAGHNGRVIIDGSNFARNGIYIGGSSGYSTDHITISGIEVRGCHYGVYIHYRASNLVFDSLFVTNWNVFGLLTAADDPAYMDGITIENSSFITDTLGGSDCLLFHGSGSHIIRNNFLHVRNHQYENGHIDGMLAMESEGFRIYNNVVIVDSNAQGQAYIIRAWADGPTEDSVIVYNNFFYQGGTYNSNEFNWTSVVNLRYLQQGSWVRPPTFIAHNTIVSDNRYVQGVVHEVPSTFVNNIVAMFGDGSTPASTYWLEAMRGTYSHINADSIRHNLIWREYEPGTRSLFTGYWDGNGTTVNNPDWDEWVNILGGTGVNANPLFVVDIDTVHGSAQALLNGELKPNSPAINAGEDIRAIIERMGGYPGLI